MSKKKAVWLRIAIGVGAVFPSLPAAAAAVEDFAGVWVNAGRGVGISQMVVTRAGRGVNLRVIGDCQPRDCNWGNVRGTVFAPAPDREAFRNASAVTANFTAGFSQKFIVLREPGRNQITVDVYTTSSDGSRRSNNYITTFRMQRSRQGGPQAGFPGQDSGPNFPGNNQGNPDQWWQQQYGQNYTYQDDSFYRECRQSPDPAGVVAGALIGGLLGYGLGDGRGGPTVAGIVVGGVAGAALTQNLNCEDRSYAYRTYYDGLNSGAPNRSYDWRNQRSGNYGSFNVNDYYNDPYGFRCANFSQEIFVQGRPQEARGRACRQPDGTWAIVNN